MEKPSGFEHALGRYETVLYDMGCGEPIAWGFRIIQDLDDQTFEALRQLGELQYIGDGWAFIAKKLSREEAIRLYGPVTEEIWGPKGGWRSVTFGNKQFKSDLLKPLTVRK